MAHSIQFHFIWIHNDELNAQLLSMHTYKQIDKHGRKKRVGNPENLQAYKFQYQIEEYWGN